MSSTQLIRSAYIFLLLTLLAGFILRCAPLIGVTGLPWTNLLHTHSHTAFLGWAFLAVMGFLEDELGSEYKKLRGYVGVSLLVSSAGIFFSFVFTGYSLLSVFFLACYTFSTYVYGFVFLTSTSSCSLFTFTSYRSFLRMAYVFHLISTLSVFLLGIISKTLGKESVEYNHAIYFYLHFQYNGFLGFALIGLLYRYFINQVNINRMQLMQRAYPLLVLSVLFTMYLSFVGGWPRPLYYAIGGIGVVFQVAGFWFFFKAFVPDSKDKPTAEREFLITALVCLLSKNILQAFSAIPQLTSVIFTNRHFIIFYLHLVMVGIITFLLVVLTHKKLLIIIPKGLAWFIIACFVFMQFFLFLQGFNQWYYGRNFPSYFLVISSMGLFVGFIALIVRLVLRKHKNDYNHSLSGDLS